MADINFTLDYDFFVGLFSESKEDAFAKLMEKMLNQILKAESSEQLHAENYQRTDNRTDYRNGTRERGLVTRLGKLELQVPRHRDVPFRTVLFEQYQRNEQALIATMMEMVVQGVSTRNIEKITQELCNETFSRSTVSEICRDLDIPVKEFRNRPLDGSYPFVMADALYIKVREGHRVISKAFFVAIGFNKQGKREVLGFEVYENESIETWTDFMNNLVKRGLTGVDLVTSDAHQGLQEAVKTCFPGTAWQRCQAHFSRNIVDKCPKKYAAGLSSELPLMFNASTIEEARRIKNHLVDEYQDVAPQAARTLDEGFEDSMSVMAFPQLFRIQLRTTNYLERENRELRKREKVIGIFPNAASALRLIGAVLMDDSNDWSTHNRSFNMERYFEERSSIQERLRRTVA